MFRKTLPSLLLALAAGCSAPASDPAADEALDGDPVLVEQADGKADSAKGPGDACVILMRHSRADTPQEWLDRVGPDTDATRSRRLWAESCGERAFCVPPSDDKMSGEHIDGVCTAYADYVTRAREVLRAASSTVADVVADMPGRVYYDYFNVDMEDMRWSSSAVGPAVTVGVDFMNPGPYYNDQPSRLSVPGAYVQLTGQGAVLGRVAYDPTRWAKYHLGAPPRFIYAPEGTWFGNRMDGLDTPRGVQWYAPKYVLLKHRCYTKIEDASVDPVSSCQTLFDSRLATVVDKLRSAGLSIELDGVEQYPSYNQYFWNMGNRKVEKIDARLRVPEQYEKQIVLMINDPSFRIDQSSSQANVYGVGDLLRIADSSTLSEEEAGGGLAPAPAWSASYSPSKPHNP